MQPDGGSRFLHVAQCGFGVCGIGRIDQHGYSDRLGHHVMQKPQPLLHHLVGEKIDAGRVAARPGEARDKTKLDRVLGDTEDDRYRRCRSFGRNRSRRVAGRNDRGDLAADQVGHQRRQPIVFVPQPVVIDLYILAVDVAGFIQAFVERGDKARGTVGRPGADKRNNRQCRLLRARCERPSRRRRRAAHQRDDLAPPHSITPSARAKIDCGTVSPSALAVLRLTQSSYLVGACTGRLAGFSPLRMRSTYAAACRN